MTHHLVHECSDSSENTRTFPYLDWSLESVVYLDVDFIVVKFSEEK